MFDIPATAALIFAIEKAKTSKNILDQKALVAGIPIVTTPMLQFLQREKQK